VSGVGDEGSRRLGAVATSGTRSVAPACVALYLAVALGLLLALAAGLLAVAFPYAQALWQTPAAASNVYQQQYQMHRFVADFYRKSVAVNDIGWVSYRRPPGVQVLDLWGLASPEASRQPNKDAGWLDDVTAAHGTGLAMIYSEWYREGAPDDWYLPASLGGYIVRAPSP
jgi:hypothetical protein